MSFSKPQVASRRRYSDVEKRHIVELSLHDDARIQEIAQRHGICQTTVSNWRKNYREGKLNPGKAASETTTSHAELLPVETAPTI